MPEMPDCECARNKELDIKINGVCMNVGSMFMLCLSEFNVCKKAEQFAFDHTLVAMVTQMTLVGTAIEPFSQEAQWEAEHVIRGLEARLLALVGEYYAEVRAMPKERQEALKAGVRKMFERGAMR